MKQIQIVRASDNLVVASHVLQTESAWEAMVGLLKHRCLQENEGMLIATSGAIHTLFMRFAIDVVFLNRDLAVKKIYHSLKPFRFTWHHFGTSAVLELPAGRCERLGIQKKDRLQICR